MKKIFFMIVVILCFMPTAGHCFEVLAYVDKNQISQEDSVLLTVVVDGGKAQVDVSMIKDFDVMSRGTSTTMNYINGNLERKATYQYVLIPKTNGKLLIPPVQATLDGEIQFSKSIVIQVTDQVVQHGEQKAVFATSRISKEKLFVGEQAVYTLQFFTSKRLGGLGYEKPPVFDGFTAKPFEKEKNYGQTINGIGYQVTEVNFMVIPQSAGQFTIDPAVLMAKVMVESNRNNPGLDLFFNDPFFSAGNYKPMRVASNPVTVEVSALPAYEGRGRYSGLVGQFDIEASMDAEEIKTGASATLTLKISGTGNIMDAGLPVLSLDEQVFKVYDDNPVENIILTSTGYEGHKIFKKALVPVLAGEFVIPSVNLVYFDVNRQTYHTASTAPVHLKVMPSGELHQAGAVPQNQTSNPLVKKEVQYENKDIFDIKDGMDALKDYHQISALFFMMYMLAPAGLFLGVKLFVVMRKKQIPVRKQMEEKAKQHIRQASGMDVGNDQFLGHLHSALAAMVLSRGNRKSQSLTMEETRQILIDAKTDKTVMDKVVHLFETIDSIRFGGFRIDEHKARSLLEETRKILKLICVVLCFFGVFSLLPHTVFAGSVSADATAQSPAGFIDGINQYRSGNYSQAAKSFEAIAKQGIRNPYLFYNIGNAYLKSEDIGHAILWYERARRLMPADPDLNFNLDHARTFVTDKKESSPDIMGVLFFWDTLFKIKDIQMAAIGVCWLFFLWASIRTLQYKRILSGTGITLLSLVVFAAVIVGEHYYSDYASPRAVIIDTTVPVRSGISQSATQLFSLHEGTTVEIQEKKDGYVKIIFSKDKTGWIKDDQAIMI
ncbi:MAG: BatD family protein [Proteobacteria bacterium]|nr:BatD family protein [Pseudomonadota bacterium]MBU1389923.1 BatD family protein [Pseudomonadota bacterium]MBU1542522.1 BatD family protein [Pseudomonadota bacterium]MBU2479691.1 BatD family protein [Pseudomonadota bacterium]